MTEPTATAHVRKRLVPCRECSESDLSQRARWAGGETLATSLMAKALANPDLVSLAAGFIDQDTLPVEPTRRAMEAIWSNPVRARAALQYGTTIGHLPLRKILMERLLAADGQTARRMNVSTDQIVVTAGSNELLYLVSDTILDPGDIVLCAAPSYFVFLGTLANLGVRAVGVEADEQGIVPEAVEEELERRRAARELHRVKAIYVISYYDNPSSVTVPAERRAALVDIAKRYSNGNRIRVIEDTAYRELRYWGEDVPSIRSFDPEGNTVVMAGSFSKSFSPGVRVGWGVLPPDLVEPVLSQKGNIDFGSPNFSQYLVWTLLEQSLFDDHVATVREGYRRKIAATLEAADEFLAPIDGVEWIHPTGGLYVWLRLPESVDTGLSGPLFDRAVREGVLYVPGVYCYPTESPRVPKNMIRLSFGVPCRDDIRRGIEALARAIHQVL
ncbi:MAG: PLP-dependent aminotransferase family protein [Pirellulales bacterium]|nr:PLP-dependent aminotransferase family protein [Pirellulales bacterium]